MECAGIATDSSSALGHISYQKTSPFIESLACGSPNLHSPDPESQQQPQTPGAELN